MPQIQNNVPANQKKMISNYSYEMNQIIGKGYSSQVFKGKNDLNNQTVAIKVIDMKMLQSAIHQELLQNEILTLKAIDNPYIMKLFDVFQTQHNTYIITEFCNQGDLSTLLKQKQRLSEKETADLMKMVMEGLKHMQQKNIIHRDLKPANILLHNGIPKIADFGFAKFIHNPTIHQCSVGTPLYMSPETVFYN